MFLEEHAHRNGANGNGSGETERSRSPNPSVLDESQIIEANVPETNDQFVSLQK